MQLMARRMLWVAGVMLPLCSLAVASSPEKLEGEYQLGGRLDEKGSPSPGKTHLYVSLTDEAAKTLYAALPGEPREDPCTGYAVKQTGEVGCYEIEPGERYFCSFSIQLERGAVETGLGGCV